MGDSSKSLSQKLDETSESEGSAYEEKSSAIVPVIKEAELSSPLLPIKKFPAIENPNSSNFYTTQQSKVNPIEEKSPIYKSAPESDISQLDSYEILGKRNSEPQIQSGKMVNLTKLRKWEKISLVVFLTSLIGFICGAGTAIVILSGGLDVKKNDFKNILKIYK
ncbi:MAG: hypothetical protein R3B45_05505 [Bdellovibrionota bacterium]